MFNFLRFIAIPAVFMAASITASADPKSNDNHPHGGGGESDPVPTYDVDITKPLY